MKNRIKDCRQKANSSRISRSGTAAAQVGLAWDEPHSSTAVPGSHIANLNLLSAQFHPTLYSAMCVHTALLVGPVVSPLLHSYMHRLVACWSGCCLAPALAPYRLSCEANWSMSCRPRLSRQPRSSTSELPHCASWPMTSSWTTCAASSTTAPTLCLPQSMQTRQVVSVRVCTTFWC